MKYIFLIFSITLSLFANEFKKPTQSIKASGNVIDLVYKYNKIYATTDAGIVDIFDYKTKKRIKKITVPDVKDFMGDNISAKIFSVDIIDGVIMLLSKSKNGYNRVHIVKNNKKSLVIDYKQQLSAIKAKLINKNTILLALLSNEIISYDIKNKKQNFNIQVNGAKFSDFCLNEDKTQVAVTDESGIVTLVDTKNGKIIKILKAQNLDNVFQVSFKNGVIASAGQDRRVSIYVPKFKSSYHVQTNFIVYGIGLSPKGKIAAYSSDEENNIAVINTITKAQIAKFTGNVATISDIEFINENEFLVSSNSNKINIYKIK
jgi:WD40 repeat protein